MSKSVKKISEVEPTSGAQDSATPSANTTSPQAEPQQISVDAASATRCYANFCRVTGAFEELLIDFGLSAQSPGAEAAPVQIDRRVIVNYFTAKRLIAALQISVQRHESLFGVLETDINKRLQKQG